MDKDTTNHTQSNIVHNVHCDSHHKHHGQNIGSIASCITIVPIFNHLEEEQMQEIMSTTKSVSYKKSELIYRAGDADDSLYIVSKGKIKIYRLSESGKEQLVRILHPGDFTGELALFRESIHEAYAEAISETNVCIMKRSELQGFLLKYPTIALKILSEFSHRLERSEQQTTRVATEKVETRLALFIADCVENGGSMEIELPMSQKDLASYLGTTPETISRKLAEFEGDGYIKLKAGRNIEVLDLDSLLSL